MTVIVASAREGRMCSDSMALDSDEETWLPAVKIFRAHGHLLGFAGSFADIKPLVDWYRKAPTKRGTPPAVDDDTEILILTRGGLKAWTRVDGFHDIDGQCHAIGAGKQAALVAMDMGADTKAAARMAVKHSAKCGGPIVVRKLRAQ